MNPYAELSLEQAEALKSEYDERYWDVSDLLAQIITDRRLVAQHIQELLEASRGTQPD